MAVACLDAKGFNAEDFAHSHPGGALGRRLLIHVKDVMRTGEAVPSVEEMVEVIGGLLSQKQRCARHQPACSRQMAIPTGIRICKIKIAGIP